MPPYFQQMLTRSRHLPARARRRAYNHQMPNTLTLRPTGDGNKSGGPWKSMVCTNDVGFSVSMKLLTVFLSRNSLRLLNFSLPVRIAI